MFDLLFLLLLTIYLLCNGREYYNFSDACTPSALGSLVNEKAFKSCSKRPGYARTVITNYSLTAFSSTVHDRTFLFIGDSTMSMQYHSFCASFGTVSDETTVHEGGQEKMKKEGDKDVSDYALRGRGEVVGGVGTHKTCHIERYNATAVFLGYGRLYQWSHTLTPSHLQVIARTAAALLPRDVILLGVGVHWHHFCDQHALRKGQLASLMNFEHALLRLLALLPTASQQYFTPQPHIRGDHKEASQVAVAASLPTLIYRESLPQHFISSNGQFPSSLRLPYKKSSTLPLRSRARKHTCIALNEASASGLGNKLPAYKRNKQSVLKSKTSRFVASISPPPRPACDPNCLPATWQNDLARSILQADYCHIGILQVFHSLECLSHDHIKMKKHDCTHYTAGVNLFLNYQFLQQLSTGDQTR
jgi:hypothetical protein